MIKKVLLLSLPLALAATAMHAEQISPQQALTIARQFANASPQLKMAGNQATSMKVAYTAQSQQGSDNLLYVVNRGTDAGYMVVAADDRAPEMVLGYTDNGTFDYDLAPENLKNWLHQYGRQIEYMIENGITAEQQRPVQTFDTSVEPLVTTLWNQDAPYNNMCNGYYTGCVATAMAQVMNYHEWPVQGTGSHSYYDYYSMRTWSANFGATTYDWNNMLDTYTGSTTQAQRNAVATLMLHCGVSCDMGYMDYASGAQSWDAARALVQYFGYPADVQIVYRDYHPYEEWVEIAKNELDNSRPILYGGYSTGGGHEFVIDGYNTDGYFHLNWGWGGQSDGYYLITTLNPYSGQGIGGGSDSGFMYMQDMIINVERPAGDEEPVYEILAESLRSNSTNVNLGNRATLTVNSMQNGSCCDVSLYLGAAIIDADGQEMSRTYASRPISGSAASGASMTSLSSNQVQYTIPSYLTDGVYHVVPVYHHADDETLTGRVKMNQNAGQYIEMTVTGGKAYLSGVAAPYENITVENLVITQNNTLRTGQETVIEADLVNNGDTSFAGPISFIIMGQSSNTVLFGPDIDYYGFGEGFDVVPVMAGQSEHISLTGVLDGFSATADYYRIAVVTVVDAELTILGEPTLISLVNGTLVNLSITVENSDNVDANNIVVHATLRNSSTSTDYLGSITARIYTNRQVATLETQSASITAGGSAELTFTGSFPDGVAGQRYSIYLYDNANGQLMPPNALFTIGTEYGNSGICQVAAAGTVVYPNPVADVLNITAPAAIGRVEVYSLAGAKVAAQPASGSTVQIDLAHLPAGTYIARITTAQGTIVEKIVKSDY